MSYPTSRRYPRSLAQAFPREHADPITFYPCPRVKLARVLVCLAALVTIGAVLALGA